MSSPQPPRAAESPDVEPDAEADAAPAAAEHAFRCHNCGAAMTWDPEADALSCAYCGERVQVPRAEGTVVERALDDAGSALRGFGVELRCVECSNCGARVSLDSSATSDVCVYCGSPNVLPQSANRNVIRPESLVPLDVGRDRVRAGFERWIRGLWFRPDALRRTRDFEAVGVYVPFWTFDCGVHSDWSADAGYYYWVTRTYHVNGRRQTRRERRVRWVPAWGSRDDVYDDLPVLASKGLPQALVDRLGGFDLKALVPYRPEYLAGWRAEEYQVDLEHGWTAAQAKVEDTQRRRCAGDVPGDTQRFLRVRNAISGVRWKHVLLPVWSLHYRFGGRTYTVLVHGQSGRVVGRAPYSWIKIGLAALAVFLVLALGALVLGLAAGR
jgi:DNA-directed RNA polymerase subunit RPC12/RpoP